MARISFRQGIVSHSKNPSSGLQTFLTLSGTNVDLSVNFGTSIEPVIMTFVHDDTDYLYTESKNISAAWTGINAGTDYWIYWEINQTTGLISRDKTVREPIIAPSEPSAANKVVGQMWFDTTKNTWFEWAGTSWIEKIRVFAAKILTGTTIQSMSINAGSDIFTGTQIGSLSGFTQARRIGSLVYNDAGRAIKKGIKRQFFTTEDEFLAGVPTGSSLRINNTVIRGEAVCPLAAFQVVEYTDFNQICPANPAVLGERVLGILDEDVITGETASFTTDGLIYNEAWDWMAAGAVANSPVYIDGTGQLTLSKIYADRPPVGLVVGKQEIYFSPKLFPQVTLEIAAVGGGLTPAQLTQLNEATSRSVINEANITALSNAQTATNLIATTNQTDITQLQTDVAGKVEKSGDTMTGPLILSADPTVDLGAATKQYIDNLILGYNDSFVAGDWSLVSGDYHLVIAQLTHGRPLNTLYDVLVTNAAGDKVSINYSVIKATGLVTIKTTGSPFDGEYRIK